MKNVIVRSLSGIVYIALIVGAILAGGWWWYALTGVFTMLGVFEYQRMTALRTHSDIPVIDAALDMTATLMLWGIAPALDYYPDALAAIVLIMAICLMARMTLALAQKHGDAVSTLAAAVFGTLYIGVPMGIMNLAINYVPYAPTAILCMFVLIWLNDTGAFCVGSLMGKHRLCQRLSPKKSWEGFWGGMFFCIVAAAVYATIEGLPIVKCAAFGVLVSIFSTWGDLFESMLKRSADVKDSGNIIPGHGGILDRIDSLLFVAPAAAIYFILLA